MILSILAWGLLFCKILFWIAVAISFFAACRAICDIADNLDSIVGMMVEYGPLDEVAANLDSLVILGKWAHSEYEKRKAFDDLKADLNLDKISAGLDQMSSGEALGYSEEGYEERVRGETVV